eukprot:PLAT13245.1.p1 GENE.PLAT13245.1~~PLAT13245.1.p1  ORF type:complete len:302 (-),score=123.39 PLAT13245.1:92-967(-)
MLRSACRIPAARAAMAPAVRLLSTAPTDLVDCSLEWLAGEGQEGIAVLSLNRPAAKNALGKNMLGELEAVVDHLASSKEARVVILQSVVDGVFCAGADLKERRTMAQEDVGKFVARARALFRSFETMGVPSIAAIEGAALGGGLELAMSCDLRVAGSDARLGLPETALAIIPGAGGTQRLPRLIGLPRAKEYILTGAQVPPAKAEDIGLVNAAVAAGGAFDKALQLATQIASKGPIAVRAAKKAINEGMQLDIEAGLKVEEDCYALVIPTKDRLEGLAAFQEKRRPVYRGE